MTESITRAFVQQFHETIQLQSQQTESRIWQHCHDRGNITGESFTTNLLAAVDELDEDTTRHGDTIWSDIEHNTRVANMADFFKAYPVDRADIPKLLANPNGAYMQRLISAKNLRKDKIAYNGMRGLALKKDNTFVALPTTQKIAHGGTGVTKAKLIQAKKLFRENECDEQADEPCILTLLYTGKMLEDILAEPTLVSADQMAVKMLQSGDVSGKWMGFNWVPYERIYNDGTTFYTTAFTNKAVHVGKGFEEGDVTRRSDKKNTMQTSMAASYGAVRAEETHVVEIAFQ